MLVALKVTSYFGLLGGWVIVQDSRPEELAVLLPSSQSCWTNFQPAQHFCGKSEARGWELHSGEIVVRVCVLLRLELKVL